MNEGEGVKITSFEMENVKRIKAVKLEPSEKGLTVIGGKNAQGKSSVLDAIAWTLGGDKYKPTNAKRDGSMVDPYMKVTLSNGLIVERKGKNSSLKVTDPSGKKSGQRLLDSFISQFALNLPKFMEASNKEKADTLLQIIGVGDQLKKLDDQISTTYNDRTAIGRLADQKKKHADEMTQWDNVPDEIVSASELIRQQQDILAKNGENHRKRQRLNEITVEKHRIFDEIQRLESQVDDLNKRIDERKKEYEKAARDEDDAMKTVAQLKDESTAELEKNIAEIDAINAKVRDNLEKQKALDEATEYSNQYDRKSIELDNLRQKRIDLLNNADLPLKGLGVEDGELTYNGQHWDGMSSAEQLKVSTAIVKKLKPNCGFVLMDKIEQMDTDTLKEFGSWLESQNMQVIATRVSTGDECSIYIEDGYSIDREGNKTADTAVKPATAWKAGEF